MEQIDADPVAYLGARNYEYVVQSSETLSKIAQERLGSRLKFVILARYNNIEVPANLVAGQTIRIPGNEPTEKDNTSGSEGTQQPDATPVVISKTSPVALQEEALAEEDSGNLESAYQLILKAKAGDPSLTDIDAQVGQIKSALIGKLEETAYSQELSGDPDSAIATWRELLEVDPTNIPAQLSIKRLEQ